MSPERPPAEVLRAFGVSSEVRGLRGGQGTSWRAGDLVLKPGGGPEHEWLGEVLGSLEPPDVRLAVPVPSVHGAWSVGGWTAARFVAGSQPDLTAPSEVLGVVEAGRALHRAFADLGRPGFVTLRDDPWAVADRVAWGERPMRFVPEFIDLASRLQAQPSPAGQPQIVHGDLTGNVLFAEGLPPAVIDLSLYWRPQSYAEGIVIADALCWHGAQCSVLGLVGVSVEAVARALLFRMATTNTFAADRNEAVDLADEARRYARAASVIGL